MLLNRFLVAFLLIQGFSIVKTKECKPGYGGPSCDVVCPDNCINCSDHSTCSTCKAGYYNGREFNNTNSAEVLDCSLLCRKNCVSCSNLDTCNECTNGYYGHVCDEMCPEGCALCTSDDVCKKCAAGFYIRSRGRCYPCIRRNCIDCVSPGHCTKCKSGFYGFRCDFACGRGCVRNECDTLRGFCACKNSFTGPHCDDCVSGMYGKYCNLTCPNCICERTSGKCVKCNSGYFLSNKTCVRCETGTWGLDCKNNCSEKCVECKPENGVCTVCSDWKFGNDCSQVCSTNCMISNTAPVCAIENGVCLNGCSTLDKHGEFCNRSCGCNCKDGFCDWKSGKCLHGCAMNYFGDYCEKMCSFSCAPTSGRRCFSRNGTCLDGCIPGYFGPDCMLKCNESCLNNVCDRESGHCSFGCIYGYSGDLCTDKSDAVSNVGNQKSNSDTGSLIGAAIGGAVGMLVIGGGLFLTVGYLRKRLRNKKTLKSTQPVNGCTGDSSNDESPPEYTEASNYVATDRNTSTDHTEAAIYQNNAETVEVQPSVYEQLQDRCRSDQQYEMVSTTIYQNSSR